jgi:hypothetical protein
MHFDAWVWWIHRVFRWVLWNNELCVFLFSPCLLMLAFPNSTTSILIYLVHAIVTHRWNTCHKHAWYDHTTTDQNRRSICSLRNPFGIASSTGSRSFYLSCILLSQSPRSCFFCFTCSAWTVHVSEKLELVGALPNVALLWPVFQTIILTLVWPVFAKNGGGSRGWRKVNRVKKRRKKWSFHCSCCRLPLPG